MTFQVIIVHMNRSHLGKDQKKDKQKGLSKKVNYFLLFIFRVSILNPFLVSFQDKDKKMALDDRLPKKGGHITHCHFNLFMIQERWTQDSFQCICDADTLRGNFFSMSRICNEKCSKPKIFLAFLSKLLCFSFTL